MFQIIIASNYSKFLECPICKKMFIQPMRLHPCGHTFCQLCIQSKKIQNSNSKSKACLNQNCKRKYTAVQKDLTAQRLIDQLKVKCLNDGCPWKGDYQEYRKYHKSQCKLKDGLDNWLKSLVKGISKEDNEKEQAYKNQTQQTKQKKPHQIEQLCKKQKEQELKEPNQQQYQKINQNSTFFNKLYQECSSTMDYIMKKIIKHPQKKN